jgi:Bacterial Ig domain
MKRVRFYMVLLIVLTGFSCSKGGNEGGDDDGTHVVSPNDVTAPVLVINTPTTNEVFATGNTINITGRITDDLGLYRGTIRVTNDANGELLKQQVYEIHGVLSYNYNVSYTPSVTVASNYTVTVSFEDHGSNATTQTVKIKVNP